MGFLDIFSGKKHQSLQFGEIKDWLDKQVEGKKLPQKIAKTKENVKNLVADARQALDNLEHAQLMNENTPVKEKQIMDGHRRAYLQRLRKFLDEIAVPDDFADIGHYAAIFSESLSELSSETQKNYMVLKHFMEVELTKVVRSIKTIEEELTALQSDIDKEGIELIKEAKIRLKQYQDDATKKERLENERENEENELDMMKQKKDKLQAKQDELKRSREYEEFKSIIEDKKKCEERINAIEQELITIFAELNRPLKKYTHNTHSEKLIDKYIADPAGALDEDSSLLIHEVLHNMQSELDTLELKDKQLERTAELLQKLTLNYMQKKRQELSTLKAENNNSAGKINRSVVALNIEENDSWLRSLDHKISEMEQDMKNTEKQIAELNLDYLKQKVREKVKEISPHVKIEDEKQHE